MESRVTLSQVQLFLGSLIIVLVTAGASVFIFFMGIQKGMQITVPGMTDEPKESSLQTKAAPIPGMLPKAMTATPKARVEQRFNIKEVDLVKLLNQEVKAAGAEMKIRVESATILPGLLTLKGRMDGFGFAGPVEIAGVPAAEGGRLVFRVERAVTAGNAIPEVLYPSIESEINRYFEEWMWGFEVMSVLLNKGEVILAVMEW